MLPDQVSHGGTYAGNRVAAAAAVKTLEILRDTDALATIHATGAAIQAGVRALLDAKGLAYHLTGHPSMFGIMFTDEVATEYRDWANTDHELYDADRASGCSSAVRCPSRTAGSRGSCARRTPRATRSTGSSAASGRRWTPRSTRAPGVRSPSMPTGRCPITRRADAGIGRTISHRTHREGGSPRDDARDREMPSGPSIGRPPCCWRWGRATARPG